METRDYCLLAPLGCFHFYPFALTWLAKFWFHSGISLMDPGDVIGLRPPDSHVRPGPPEATSVGGGGSEDQRDPVRALHNTHGPFPYSPQGWGRTVIR